MTSLPMVEAKNQLTTLAEELARDKELGVIAVTKDGKPILAVMPWEVYESLIETLEIMSDPEMMEAVRQDKLNVKEGKSRGIPLEQVKAELGL